MLACIIRYQIDPTKKLQFEEYARNWGQAIPRCGADLVGYYSPHEGSTTRAYGIYNIESLAAYETYRARFQQDPLGKQNYEFAQKEKFLLREDRTFLTLASGFLVTLSLQQAFGEAVLNENNQIRFDLFKKLHQQKSAFVLANAWDAGSAKLLQSLGFAALGTSSAGFAFSCGKRDSSNCLSSDDILANARAIVNATKLPVSADLEHGFGDSPQACVETVVSAMGVGLAGGSIEDATGDAANPIYDFELAVDRIAAVSEATKGKPFLLTARAENYLHGRPDLDDTIRRLQAFEKAGADVLYAPGLNSIKDIRRVCESVTKPVNVVMGLGSSGFTVQQLSEAGVKRISIGGSFARAALGELMRAAGEVATLGTFTYIDKVLPDPGVIGNFDSSEN